MREFEKDSAFLYELAMLRLETIMDIITAVMCYE